MATAGRTALTVEPVAGALGASVTGMELARVSEAAQLDELRRALADHLVVFLPDQELDLDALERVTDLLGGRDVTPFVEPLEDRPYVIRVIKEPGDALNFANAWHSDLSYLPEPPAYTLLHAWDVPDHGGDTVWSNQYLAYETLSGGLRATLDGLRAVHSAGMAYGTGGLLDQVKDFSSMAIAPSAEAFAEHVQPVVIVHPVTGRRALYVNPVYTTRFEGWTKEESHAVLAHVPAQHQRELHLPPALVGRDARHLGQPLHDAQRAERLLRRAPRDVPHQCEGRPAERRALRSPRRPAAPWRARGRAKGPGRLACRWSRRSGPEDDLDGVGRLPVDGRLDGLPVVVQPELVRHHDRVREEPGFEHGEGPVDGVATRAAGEPR